MRDFIVTAIFCMIAAAGAFAQDPVHFTYLAKRKAGKQYELHITATMEAGWHIYAQQQPKEAIAQPTLFNFSKGPLFAIMGTVKEIGKREMYNDPVSGITQFQYGGKVEFVQRFTLNVNGKITLTGSVTYQACTDERCLQPKTVNFSVPVE